MAATDQKKPANVRDPLIRAPALLLLMLILSACICQQPAWGKGAGEKQEPTYRRESRREPLPGGFIEIPVNEEQALEAFAFLGGELEKTHPDILLGAVKQAARQIVAGTNIRLVCAYRLPSDPAAHELYATVYFDLKGGRSLRSIAFNGQAAPAPEP
jgi:hypothetical protein